MRERGIPRRCRQAAVRIKLITDWGSRKTKKKKKTRGRNDRGERGVVRTLTVGISTRREEQSRKRGRSGMGANWVK